MCCGQNLLLAFPRVDGRINHPSALVPLQTLSPRLVPLSPSTLPLRVPLSVPRRASAESGRHRGPDRARHSPGPLSTSPLHLLARPPPPGPPIFARRRRLDAAGSSPPAGPTPPAHGDGAGAGRPGSAASIRPGPTASIWPGPAASIRPGRCEQERAPSPRVGSPPSGRGAGSHADGRILHWSALASPQRRGVAIGLGAPFDPTVRRRRAGPGRAGGRRRLRLQVHGSTRDDTTVARYFSET